MSRWSRRRFLAATAAAACVGCSETGAEQGVTAGTARPGPAGASDPATGSRPGFGVGVAVGAVDEVLDRIAAEGAVHVPEARAFVNRFPVEAFDAGSFDPALHDGLRAGLVALYQKCPHLGCRVPFCTSSGWFECPCHGSRYNGVGEHRAGPGPRGLDTFALRIRDDQVLIDTDTIVPGQPLGTSIVDQDPAGPHCVDAAEH